MQDVYAEVCQELMDQEVVKEATSFAGAETATCELFDGRTFVFWNGGTGDDGYDLVGVTEDEVDDLTWNFTLFNTDGDLEDSGQLGDNYGNADPASDIAWVIG